MAIVRIFILSLIVSPSLVLSEEQYRLPKLYDPLSYQIQLTIPSEAFTATGDEFSGIVAILFSVTNVTNYISLHAQHSFINVSTINVSDITTALNETNIPVTGFTINNVTDILTINLANNLTVDVIYVLTIEYTGKLSTTDMYGLYKSTYDDGNGTMKYLVTTQFESTYARRAFPCFDEPALKATFDVIVTAPSGLNVLSNTPQGSNSTDLISGLTSITFNTTARMSTYLLALIVSEFTCTSGASVGVVPYQVCSRNQSASTRALAVEFGPQILAGLNNFTNYDYSLSMEKLDLVAIPDFAAGAMENWGLVTYRETALLWDNNESSNRYKQRVVTVIAHELSHQWFGNLITMKWWSETFLNEGFATYFEFFIPHEILPTWELDKQFVLEEHHAALLSDALQNAQPLQLECSTPAEISARFGTVSYSKGGSVLRMVEHFMGLENFRAGLQQYLLTYAYNNTVPENLWAILGESVVNSVSKLPANLTAVMENWVKLPGFPLLTVTLSGDTIIISQKRFLLSGGSTDSEWYVPISYTTSASTNKSANTTPDFWLIPDEDATITLPQGAQWIILNNQQSAYYRVNYDNTLWYRIRAALLNDNFDGISELNRAQIVDDLFNLARADHLRYSTAFDIMTFLYNDVSYFSWYPALQGYNFLLRRVGEDSSLGQSMSWKILEIMTAFYLSVPLSTLNEDDQIYTHSQVMAHSWACRLGAPKCINEVRGQFSEFRYSGTRPNKNFRAMVYCYGLRYSTDTTDWDFLWNTYINSTDLATEQITILTSLGCTNDTVLLRGYLTKSITEGSGIRLQDAVTVFSSVYTGSTVGVDVAFEFLIENHVTIAERYQSWNSLGNLIKGIAERFTKQTQVDRLRNFTENGNLTDAFKLAASEALETAEANLRWLAKYENELEVYYSSAGLMGSSLIAMCLALICIIFNR